MSTETPVVSLYWTEDPPETGLIDPSQSFLEERSYRPGGRVWPPQSAGGSGSSRIASFSSPVLIGLPPTPRGHRKLSPISPRARVPSNTSTPHRPDTQISLRNATSAFGFPGSPGSSSSASNPHISPTPLDSVTRPEEQSGQYIPSRKTPVSAAPRAQEGDETRNSILSRRSSVQMTRPPRDELSARTLPRSPCDGHCTLRNRDQQQPSNVSQQSTSRFTLVPRADRSFSKGKTAFDRIPEDSTTNIRRGTHDICGGLGEVPQHHHKREGNLEGKDMSMSGRRVDETRQADEVLDIWRQRTSLDSSDISDVTYRRRPLLSHGPRSPSMSSSESASIYSETTVGPASTLDDRHISISSTIYPSSSSSHSHSHSMYDSLDSPLGIPPSRRSSLMFNTPHSPPAIPRNRTHSQDASANEDRHSFIEIFSPLDPGFVLTQQITDHETIRKINAKGEPSSPKPPFPTAPKPNFSRSSANPALLKTPARPSSRTRHADAEQFEEALPPTTNFLDLGERADLIRKSRKLTQVFGQPPGADALSQQDCGRSPHLTIPSDASSKYRHQRGTLSMSTDLETSTLRLRPRGVWPPTEGTQYVNASGRRHSTPLSPDDFSFLSEETRSSLQTDLHIEIGTQEGTPSSDLSADHALARNKRSSLTSFIDLSDDDGISAIISQDPSKKVRSRRLRSSPSVQSLYENMTPVEQAEEERRKKREKLAKLHRFLGSRVPTDLVLGIDFSPSLPPPGVSEGSMNDLPPNEDLSRRAWIRRRRSSSVIAYPSTWSDDLDRLKEDLNDKEKAINVRRAQKMEKVFGVAPPQTLYHTRYSPSPSSVAVTGPPRTSSLAVPIEPSPPPAGYRNPNRSSYTKAKAKKIDRPSTSESSKQLLPKGRDSQDVAHPPIHRTSLVYNHYQHSLDSLNDILDRDDRESLAELHQYLNSGDLSSSPPLQEFSRIGERRLSIASIKSERRRSLPARTSMLSIASEYSITSPKPEVTDFQLRRRRAAKLTQFFGVDYRDLINDVLESIEHGLEHERKRGTLNPDEVEELLQRLRNLRTKREGIF